jgi:SAM-dependent methyltransferase
MSNQKANLSSERRRQLWRRLRRPALLGTIRRLTPLSEYWGIERGTPVDRYYIDTFLSEHRQDIHGRVLEIRDSRYADEYGVGVQQREVLDIDSSNPRATIIADLARADAVPPNQFDCVVLTQTLQYIYDARAAIGHVRRILRPGGVLLATVPSVSRIDPHQPETDLWRFTPGSCSALFTEAFEKGAVTIHSYGNVLTAIAFLTGMAQEELSRRELDAADPFFPLVIGVRAVKAGTEE